MMDFYTSYTIDYFMELNNNYQSELCLLLTQSPQFHKHCHLNQWDTAAMWDFLLCMLKNSERFINTLISF